MEGIANGAGDLTEFDIVLDSAIFIPPRDGIPGGYASINLTGSADNASGTPVNLEFLFWESMEDTVHVDSLSGFIPTWQLDSLKQDANSLLNIFTVSLDSRSVDKFLGKKEFKSVLKSI